MVQKSRPNPPRPAPKPPEAAPIGALPPLETGMRVKAPAPPAPAPAPAPAPDPRHTIPVQDGWFELVDEAKDAAPESVAEGRLSPPPIPREAAPSSGKRRSQRPPK